MDYPSAPAPRLYYDLGSPYSWLTFERIEEVMGAGVRLEPILIGGIFQVRGWGSWSQTESRRENVEEIERRAAGYGIGPVEWPENWPDNTLLAMRCAIWAEASGSLETFTKIAFRSAFRKGLDLSDSEVLAGIAEQADLEPSAMLAAAESREVKDELRERTDRAWALGVAGAPSVAVGGRIFYGDDQLELAARAHRDEDPGR